MFDFLKKVFDSNEREVNKLRGIVEEINALEPEMESLTDEQLRAKTDEFKQRLRQGETLDDLLVEAYAVVREAAKRNIGERPFDVQLMGAIVLHQGRIAEMVTGEGKTLAATMPLYLNALLEKGVHLVTVNDFLARRDAKWMGPIYLALGLTVGALQHERAYELIKTEKGYELQDISRRQAYQCDITYGTNNEFGFDYLRDNMAISEEELVQRGHYYTIVDEVDSILIDEARTPLIISGVVDRAADDHKYDEVKPLVLRLVNGQRIFINRILKEADELLKNKDTYYEGGIKLLQSKIGAPKNKRLKKFLEDPEYVKLTERVELDFLRDKRMPELEEELLYAIDERSNIIKTTDKGRDSMSPQDRNYFVIPDIDDELYNIDNDKSLSEEEKEQHREAVIREYEEKNDRIHSISQLLKAYSLFEKDVDYVVNDNKVIIVDEFTGRLMPGRRYSDGLHQALEAKEGVRIEKETQTLATITLQNYFRLYDKLAGMTGTAKTEEGEFEELYKMDVVVIPTNKPLIRKNYPDVIYKTEKEKFKAIVREIKELHAVGRPVLIGTISIEKSELLSRLLGKGIPHEVLNAKYHEKEAEITAKAGQKGVVTIATNMAGRGTNITLGPGVVDPSCLNPLTNETKCCIGCQDDCKSCFKSRRDECEANVPCGLHVIGTERHEARRIDNQLRGRTGRQGDPGSSRFYLSLEDDLMRLFGSDRLSSVMGKLGVEEDVPIEHPLITKSIEMAQKRVEARNFDIRKQLLEYDDVMEKQRDVIYEQRRQVLEGEDLRDEIREMIEDLIEEAVDICTENSNYPEEWDFDKLARRISHLFPISFKVKDEDKPKMKRETLKEQFIAETKRMYELKEEALGSEEMRELERRVMLMVVDNEWKDHLHAMDELKAGVGLRAYAQRDPLIEYKKSGYEMFQELISRIREEVVRFIYRVQIVKQPALSRFATRDIKESRTGESVSKAKRNGRRERALVTSSAANTEGERQKPRTYRREGAKVGRNDPCPCGSGKKYKHCCGRK